MEKASVLLVDDEQDIASLLESSLKNHGFSVKAFTNPLHALEHFKVYKDDYDVLVSDVRMPGISGFELVKNAKIIKPSLKAILLTAFEIQKQELAKVMPSYRVDYLLAKPVSAVQLIETINKCL